MHLFWIVLSTVFLMTACGPSFEKEKLYGTWQNKEWRIVFDEEGSCAFNDKKGKFSFVMGNAIEVNFEQGATLPNLTIEYVTDEELKIVFRFAGTDSPQILKRVTKR